MTYRVVDTIPFRESWTRHHEEFAGWGEGLLVILDPEQTREAPAIEGRAVTVRRPDGTTAELTVHLSKLGGNSTVGLFFRGASAGDVPRESLISW